MKTAHKGTALITGASTGIGEVYAHRLASRGYDLVLVARSRPLLDSLAKKLRDETHQSVEVLAANLSDAEQLASVEAKLRTDNKITLLVNNAGVASAAPLIQSNVDQMTAMIALNVTALTRLTYAVVPGMVAKGTGAIINISSIVAVNPELLNGVYGATKSYVLAFSQSLQHELSAKGIRIQAVMPGATRTALWTLSGVDIDSTAKGYVMTPEDMVDAALVGFDNGEVVTIPALPEVDSWIAFESARLAMIPNLSRSQAASRYAISIRSAA